MKKNIIKKGTKADYQNMTLNILPFEIWFHILELLGPKITSLFCCLSMRAAEIANSEVLWKHFFKSLCSVQFMANVKNRYNDNIPYKQATRIFLSNRPLGLILMAHNSKKKFLQNPGFRFSLFRINSWNALKNNQDLKGNKLFSLSSAKTHNYLIFETNITDETTLRHLAIRKKKKFSQAFFATFKRIYYWSFNRHAPSCKFADGSLSPVILQPCKYNETKKVFEGAGKKRRFSEFQEVSLLQDALASSFEEEAKQLTC